MAVITLVPNNDHTIAQDYQGSLYHYLNIDETVLNEADYNYCTNSNLSKTDRYGFSNPTGDAGVRAQAINGVALKIKAKNCLFVDDKNINLFGFIFEKESISIWM